MMVSCRLLQAQEDTIGNIPFKQDDVYSYGFLGRIILVTLICLALAVAVVWILRRVLFRNLVGPDGSRESIQLMSHRRITPKMSVFVLEIEQHRVAVVQVGDALIHIPLERSSD